MGVVGEWRASGALEERCVFDLMDIPAATPPPGVAEKAPSLPGRVPGDPGRLLPTSSPRFPGGALPEAPGGGGVYL